MASVEQNKHLAALVNVGIQAPEAVDGMDPIMGIAYHIENLDSDQAIHLAQTYSEFRGFSAFVMGGALSVISMNQWFKDFGYSSMREFIESGLGMAKSTAYDYIKIYDAIVESEIPWVKVQSVGWTKLRWFARYLTSENVDQWVKIAESITANELRISIKELARQVGEEAIKPKFGQIVDVPESTQVDSKAANDEGEEQEPNPEPDLVEEPKLNNSPLITEEAALQTLQSVTFKLYPEQKQVVDTAIEFVMKDKPTNCKGEALTCVCEAFLAQT